MKDEALRLALEALEYPGPSWLEARQPAITAIKQAFAQPEPEPVAWTDIDFTNIYISEMVAIENNADVPLYTSPQRTWVGLTDDEIDLLEELYAPPAHPDFVNDADHCTELIRHVEAKLKEKNNG